MIESREDAAFERLVQKAVPQGKLVRRSALKGGVSAEVTALEIVQPGGQIQKLVVRRHGTANLRQNPRVAADEFRLLQVLRAADVPAPEPYYFDQSGEIFATPCVVVEFIEGETEFSAERVPDLTRQLAVQLVLIHRVDHAQTDLSFMAPDEDAYSWALRERPERIDVSLDEGQIRKALRAVWPLPRRNAPVLLHGDFWPGNILWRDGRIVAVIDWEDAALGDPLTDLGKSRLEILWAYGREAMAHFTRQYQDEMTHLDFTDLPYWDLCAALRPVFQLAAWAADASAEVRMREGHRWFIGEAFARIGAGRGS